MRRCASVALLEYLTGRFDPANDDPGLVYYDTDTYRSFFYNKVFAETDVQHLVVGVDGDEPPLDVHVNPHHMDLLDMRQHQFTLLPLNIQGGSFGHANAVWIDWDKREICRYEPNGYHLKGSSQPTPVDDWIERRYAEPLDLAYRRNTLDQQLGAQALLTEDNAQVEAGVCQELSMLMFIYRVELYPRKTWDFAFYNDLFIQCDHCIVEAMPAGTVPSDDYAQDVWWVFRRILYLRKFVVKSYTRDVNDLATAAASIWRHVVKHNDAVHIARATMGQVRGQPGDYVIVEIGGVPTFVFNTVHDFQTYIISAFGVDDVRQQITDEGFAPGPRYLPTVAKYRGSAML